jgi:hypothetical protein
MATIVKTPVRAAPKVAHGAGVTEYLFDSVEYCKSRLVNFNDTTPEVVFTLPANIEVLGVYVQVVTTFDGLVPSIALGTAATPGLLVGTNDVDLTTAGFTAIVNKPRNFTADTSLQVTIVSVGTQGQVRFGLKYRSVSNFLA